MLQAADPAVLESGRQSLSLVLLHFTQPVRSDARYEIEFCLTHRMKRQGILHREEPLSYSASIHESALRMRFGGPAVRSGRLKHLLAMSELPHVTVRVIPFDTEYYPSTGQSFDYVQGPVPQLDTLQLDT